MGGASFAMFNVLVRRERAIASTTRALAGFIGGIAGVIANGVLADSSANVYYAVLAGYAGGDFFENAFKIISKKPMLFKLPDILSESLKDARK